MSAFKLTQNGEMYVRVDSPNRQDALMEIRRYAAVYEQDGPVKIWEYVNRRWKLIS